MITPTQLRNSFHISGSNTTLVYEKYKTTELPDIKLFVSNSSTIFDIQLFPTGNIEGTQFISDNKSITPTSPLKLLRRSNDNINFAEILVKVDTSNLDATPVASRDIDIKFNMVALVDVNETATNSGNNTPCTSNSNCASNYCLDGVCTENPNNKSNGSICTDDSNCASSYCNKINSSGDTGVCSQRLGAGEICLESSDCQSGICTKENETDTSGKCSGKFQAQDN